MSGSLYTLPFSTSSFWERGGEKTGDSRESIRAFPSVAYFPRPQTSPVLSELQACLDDTGLAPIDAAEPAHGAELAVAEPHARVADHAGVEAQHLADVLLRGHARVEAHGEVVAGRVAHLVHAHGPGQGELAPVLQAADHAVLLQHELARG